MSQSPLIPDWERLDVPVIDNAEPEDADLEDGYEEQPNE